ncbi:MAG: rhamnulokinase family protein [Armatimonadota bacterium]|nr:rhamnulokinase family protein [Armatimonadota bacterium]
MRVVAVDLGAESGRCVLATVADGRVETEVVGRFPNGPVRVAGRLHWDVLHLFREITDGLRRCAARGPRIDAISVDTWGVDYALVDSRGTLIGLPYHYRDTRTEGMMDEAFRRVPSEEVYRTTGIQFMPINTLYQLLAQVVTADPALQIAHRLLLMPDLFHFWLSGVQTTERTIASTTQCLDARTGGWAWAMLERLGLPVHLLPPVAPPASVLGPLLSDVAEDVGLRGAVVVAAAGHDTAAAVAAIPADRPGFAYISSGTWSLVGVEADAPVLTDAARRANITNEAGVGGTVRVLKNVTGLWLLQECRRRWSADGPVDYADLMRLAEQAPPFGAVVDPDHDRFLRPTDMPAAVQQACRETGQRVPQGPGEITRCILESLAAKYRYVLDTLEEITGRDIDVVHVVGGGSRNALLCQMTADAAGRLVLAGPEEATALGNALVQAMALGQVGSVAELRAVVRRSVPLRVYEPRRDDRWERAVDTLRAQVRAHE